MKAIIPTKFCTIEIDCDSVKDIFREVGGISEIFNEEKCGLCGNTSIIPKTRSVEKNKKVYEYFEMGCTNSKCRARLSYGQRQDGGGIFPIRKLDSNGKPDREAGSYGPHNGWSKYRGENKDE